MSSINSLKAIEHKIKELRAKAREIRREEQKGVEELRAVIVKYKLGFAHCKIAMRGAGTERSTRAKSTMAPKYRSLHNEALVWSGRGRKPSWIVAGLRNGRKLDEFLIERSQQETPAIRLRCLMHWGTSCEAPSIPLQHPAATCLRRLAPSGSEMRSACRHPADRAPIGNSITSPHWGCTTCEAPR